MIVVDHSIPRADEAAEEAEAVFEEEAEAAITPLRILIKPLLFSSLLAA